MGPSAPRKSFSRVPMGLLDSNTFSHCHLVNYLVDVQVVGLTSQVSSHIVFQNTTDKDFTDAVFQMRVAEGATISWFDCVVKESGPDTEGSTPRYQPEPRALRNASLESSVFKVNVGKIHAGRYAVLFLRYDHNATIKNLEATFLFPLPGRRGENMITRSRQDGNEGDGWNGSHIFSFATVDIEASMPGQISKINSSTHLLSSKLNLNKAKISVENHVLQGEDNLEFSITADNLDAAMEYYYKQLEEKPDKPFSFQSDDFPQSPSNYILEEIARQHDDDDDEELEDYFNKNLIPQDEIVKFNINSLEPKSLIMSKLCQITLTEREIMPRESLEIVDEDEMGLSPQSFLDIENDLEDQQLGRAPEGCQAHPTEPEPHARKTFGGEIRNVESLSKIPRSPLQTKPPKTPELNSWYMEDSESEYESDIEEFQPGDDHNDFTADCLVIEGQDREGYEIDPAEDMDMDMDGLGHRADNEKVFVGTALAVNHIRPKLVNITVTKRKHRKRYIDDSDSDISESSNGTRVSTEQWRQQLYTPTFGQLQWTENLTAILDDFYRRLERSPTGFILLDESFAQIVGIRFERLLEFLRYACPETHTLSPVANNLKRGAWANIVALSHINFLAGSHNIEKAGVDVAEKFNRLYSHLHGPLLQHQMSYSLPLPLMSEMATDLVLNRTKDFDNFNKSRKAREVAVIGLGVFTPPASPPKTPA